MKENDPESNNTGAKLLTLILALSIALVTCAIAWVGWTSIDSVQKKAGTLHNYHVTAENTKVDSHRYDDIQDIDRQMFSDKVDPVDAMISGGGKLAGSEIDCSKAGVAIRYNHYGEAVTLLSQALEMIPSEAKGKASWTAFGGKCDRPMYTARTRQARAFGYIQMGQYLQAITDLTEAIKLYPEYIEYQERSFCYCKAGKPELALADLTEAIRLRPDDTSNYANRARAHYLLGQKALGDADIKTAQSLPKSNLPE
jgi:tetratricopeptide (TPR) repeat protein